MPDYLQGPVNYGGIISDIDIGAEIEKNLMAKRLQAAQQQQLALKLQQQQQLQAAQQAYITDPSAKNLRALFALNPEGHQAYKASFDAMRTDQQDAALRDQSAIRGFLQAKLPDEAVKLLKRRRDADFKAGMDTSDDDQMLELIQSDPQAALAAVDYHLAAAMGPDKWADAFGKITDSRREDAKLPGELAKTDAETLKIGSETANIDANAAKTTEETKQIAPNAASERQFRNAQAERWRAQSALEAEKNQIDRDTLESNVQLKLQELSQTPMSDSTTKLVNEKVVSSESSRMLANRATDLADKFETAAGAAGGSAGASWSRFWSGAGFDQSQLVQLRREAQQLLNSQAIKNLPPGPATDKDIQMALKGFPNSNESPATLTQFLRGMAKLQNYVANTEQAQADWASANNGLGRLRKDTLVNGTLVPAGTSWGEFRNSQAAGERKEAAKGRSYMRFGQ